MAEVAGFEPATYLGVKDRCLEPLGDTSINTNYNDYQFTLATLRAPLTMTAGVLKKIVIVMLVSLKALWAALTI